MKSKNMSGPVRAGSVLAAVTVLFSTDSEAGPVVLESWEGLLPDPQVKRDGRPGLRWPAIARTTSVRSLDAPKDLTPYATISFWMRVARPTDSRLSLVFMSDDPETKG